MAFRIAGGLGESGFEVGAAPDFAFQAFFQSRDADGSDEVSDEPTRKKRDDGIDDIGEVSGNIYGEHERFILRD